MKYKTTKADVMNGYGFVVSSGFGNLQNLLSLENPVAYTCGVYGWNADVYQFEGFAIVTGYRPFGVAISFEMVREVERKAKSIRNRKNWGYNAKRRALNRLAWRMCYELANSAR